MSTSKYKPSWWDVPAWTNFIAQSKNDEWECFEKKPFIDGDSWSSDGYHQLVSSKPHLAEIPDEIWQGSIEPRPPMMCNICNEALIPGNGTKIYETTSDHVCDPNGTPPSRPYMICSNPECVSRSHKMFWDLEGEVYYREAHPLLDTKEKKDLYYRDRLCLAAYHSYARKVWTEIYRKDKTSAIFVGRLGGYLYHDYVSDWDGNILKDRLRLQLLLKQEDGSQIWYTPGIIYLMRTIRGVFTLANKYSKKPSTFTLDLIKRECKPLPDWDTRWWRKMEMKTSRFIVQSFYPEILLKMLEQEKSKCSFSTR